ncbi:hypothetical protein [Legionella rowbothamii]|uniref:hypothetical protein n=1 Tax=Legionella rowbothamii TaxID=96229 RepID=UPI0010559541|nr:hypothetical protein [Legionella rowbothamii]
MEYYLKKKFIHFNGIDGWECKRIYSLFIDIAINHHCCNSVKEFINYLSIAPSRSAAYISFNLTPYYTEEEGVANIIPYPNSAIPEEAPYKYVAENLDIKYFKMFDLTKRVIFARETIRKFAPNIEHMIKDCLKYSMASEFNSFSYNFERLLKGVLSGEKESPSTKALEMILNDFYRCQIAQKYKKLVERAMIGTQEIDYSCPTTQLYHNQIRVKQELLNIRINTFNFLDSCKVLFSKMGNNKLVAIVDELQSDYVNTTKPSLLPKSIPVYIER